MSATTFAFDEQPDRVYQAERDDNGFITIGIAVPGGEFTDVCGFAVTQTPPPPEGG